MSSVSSVSSEVGASFPLSLSLPLLFLPPRSLLLRKCPAPPHPQTFIVYIHCMYTGAWIQLSSRFCSMVKRVPPSPQRHVSKATYEGAKESYSHCSMVKCVPQFHARRDTCDQTGKNFSKLKYLVN